MRSITSVGLTIIFFAIDSNSWPLTGSTSQFLFWASAMNSGSLRAFISPSRRIVSRSAGTPGGAIKGRPIKSGDIRTVAKRRVTSATFRRSINSYTVGTSCSRRSRFGAPMDEDPSKAILGPGPSRFAAEVTFQTAGATLHFALLHRQVDFRRTGVARDDVELYACDFFDEPGKIVAHGAECRGAAAWMLRLVPNVVQCFIGRIGPAINNPHRPFRRSDPGKPRPIELHFFHVCELIEIETWGHEADREPVRLGDTVYIVRRRQRTCAGHVL